MQKVLLAARKADQDRLLTALRELGVVHVEPVDARQAVPPPALAAELDRGRRAVQVLEQLSSKKSVSQAPQVADLPPDQVANRVLAIQRESAELHSRLSSLRRQLEQLAVWGDVRLEHFEQLRQAGVDVRFAAVARDQMGQVRAELVHVLGPVAGGRVVVAAVNPAEQPWPTQARPMPLPPRDRPSIRAEAAEIDAQLTAGAAELESLVSRLDDLRADRLRLERDAEFAATVASGLDNPDLFALQGWAPADRAERLAGELADRDLTVAVQLHHPADNEQPPTLIRYPRWTRPIKGLFDILLVDPGYREPDVSPFFMIALPLFTAMLISDGAYGLIMLLAPLLMYRRFIRLAGGPVVHLTIVMGAACVAWGVLTNSWFGFALPYHALAQWQGPLGAVGWLLTRIHFTDAPGGPLDPGLMRLMMVISFYIGAVHLSSARLWRAALEFPHPRFLSQIGWAMFLWGMLYVVLYLVVVVPLPWFAAYLLIIGGALAVLFEAPSRNPLRMIGLGLAQFPLAAIGTLSDTISYVRLMAVGLASTVLAISFNAMAAASPLPLAAAIMLFGHALNFTLCIIAIFAHGVRLNMLEFSNNMGVQWSGYPYQPFELKGAR